MPDIQEVVKSQYAAVAQSDLTNENTGSSHVVVIDSGADFSVYAKVTGQSACCAPPMSGKKSVSLAVESEPCCGPSCCTPVKGTAAIHDDLVEILSRYNINEFAASVKVYAVKPV